LTPSSIIQLTNNDGISSTGYLTPGVLEISYPVPEPSTGLLAMLGFAALARYWRRRR
jgi:MYXO-CTERM domain-containing protein